MRKILLLLGVTVGLAVAQFAALLLHTKGPLTDSVGSPSIQTAQYNPCPNGKCR